MSIDRVLSLDLCRPFANNNTPQTEEYADRSLLQRRRRRLAQRGYIGVSSSAGNSKVRFAAVGDVHGQFSLLSQQLKQVAHRLGVSLDFVLQVGDIECHRNEDDLQSMAAPAKFRTLGDFGPACYQMTEGYLQYPMYFIGGNHECYGWLDNEDHFGRSIDGDDESTTSQAFLEVARNVFYLGRAGYLPLRFFVDKMETTDNGFDDKDYLDITGVLHLAFVSGIHRGPEYHYRRPAMTSANLETTSNRRWIGFNIYDTQLLLEDEVDDGIDHSKYDDDEEYYELQREDLSGKHLLMFLLARLLGVNLTQQHLSDTSFDVVLSMADVKFLTRFIILSSLDDNAEDIVEKRHRAAENLPHSLVGIVDILLKRRSEEDIQTSLDGRSLGKNALMA